MYNFSGFNLRLDRRDGIKNAVYHLRSQVRLLQITNFMRFWYQKKAHNNCFYNTRPTGEFTAKKRNPFEDVNDNNNGKHNTV